jgi:hypothetical protein
MLKPFPPLGKCQQPIEPSRMHFEQIAIDEEYDASPVHVWEEQLNHNKMSDLKF